MELYKGDVNMLKKMVAVAGIAITALSLTGCFGGNKYAEHKDAEWYSIYKAFYYSNECIGSEFNDERKDIIDEMNDMLEDNPKYTPVKRNNDGTISKTMDAHSRLLYVGEWDDNVPDGIGTLYYKSAYTGDIMPSYMGEWEDGKQNGYGCIFKQESHNQKTGSGRLDYITVFVPVLMYEGYFEENEPQGKGISYYINPPHFKQKYRLHYGDHEGHQSITGKGKEFTDGILMFSGEMETGTYYGEGKQYYKNGELKYEGEFKGGKYNGDGVLYDENGKKIYSGEFENGNFK